MNTGGKEKTAWRLPSRTIAYHDASLFSSSLPVLSHDNLNFNGSNQSGLSLDDGFPSLSKLQLLDEVQDPLEDIDPPISGTFLPGDEDELLAGLMDDFDLRNNEDELSTSLQHTMKWSTKL